MSNIKDSLKILHETAQHNKTVWEYGLKKYAEKMEAKELAGSVDQPNTYNYYDGFEVRSDNTIRVKYKYGAGEMDFEGFFDVEI